MIKALTKKRNNKGFTLVELIVVIAILAVLMAILVPQYIQYVERSRQGVDASAFGEILHAVEIEAALQTAPEDFPVTVAADGAISVGPETETPFSKAVTDVTGATITTQSGAMKAARTLNISITDGKAEWDDPAPELIEALQAGTATTATGVGTGG